MKKFFEFLRRCWEEREWRYLIPCLLLGLACIGCSIVFIVWVFNAFFHFLAVNFETISTVFVVCFAIGGYCWYKQDERREKQRELAEREAAAQLEIEAENAAIAEKIAANNYTIIRQCLFSVLSEKAGAIGLEKPTALSELDSPARLIPRNGYVICEYIAMKQGTSVDTSLIMEYLQTKITQRLNAGEFPELPATTYVYEGRAFPILHLDSISDAGAYIQIRAVLVNEAYCRALQKRSLARLENHIGEKRPLDGDF